MAFFLDRLKLLYQYFPDVIFRMDGNNLVETVWDTFSNGKIGEIVDMPEFKGLFPDFEKNPDIKKNLLEKFKSSEPFDIMRFCLSCKDNRWLNEVQQQLPEISLKSQIVNFFDLINKDPLEYHTYNKQLEAYEWYTAYDKENNKSHPSHYGQNLGQHKPKNIYLAYQYFANFYYRKCITGYELKHYKTISVKNLSSPENTVYVNIMKKDWEKDFFDDEIPDLQKAILYSMFIYHNELRGTDENLGIAFFMYLSMGYARNVFIENSFENHDEIRIVLESLAFIDCAYVLEGDIEESDNIIVSFLSLIGNIASRWKHREKLNISEAKDKPIPFSQDDLSFIRNKIMIPILEQEEHLTDPNFKELCEKYRKNEKKDVEKDMGYITLVSELYRLSGIFVQNGIILDKKVLQKLMDLYQSIPNDSSLDSLNIESKEIDPEDTIWFNDFLYILHDKMQKKFSPAFMKSIQIEKPEELEVFKEYVSPYINPAKGEHLDKSDFYSFYRECMTKNNENFLEHKDFREILCNCITEASNDPTVHCT